jgi:hypothetical protein
LTRWGCEISVTGLGRFGSIPDIQVSAIPAPNQKGLAKRGSDHLLKQAESLIGVLSEEDVVEARTVTNLLELIVDGYAHVLALDVDRRRLDRDIARLVGSGDPQAAAELRRLSAQRRDLTSASEQLRELLGEVRARDERHGRH